MNRRTFIQRFGVGPLSGTFVPGARAAEPVAGRLDVPGSAASTDAPIRLGNNENPYGPGPLAIQAINHMMVRANRYPGPLAQELVSAIARTHDVPREYILLSGGSGDIMRAAVYTFTSRTRSLVTARPGYEAPMRSAQHIGSPVIHVPLTPALRLDLAVMGAKAVGAGLVYICSPNNPTSTVIPAARMIDMIEAAIKVSPTTRFLVDEAYFDYADRPGFDTMIPLAAKYPQVITTRTFSKIHGMAGMRVGYAVAQATTIAEIKPRHSRSSLSSMSLAAAVASLGDTQHHANVAARNREVRTFMVETFASAGYRVAAADANFIFVDIRRDARGFKEACRVKGVEVGRAFPPMNTWARISVGTREEMNMAMSVFMDVLSSPRPRVERPRASRD